MKHILRASTAQLKTAGKGVSYMLLQSCFVAMLALSREPFFGGGNGSRQQVAP
jgi:hypothetical protein